MMKHYETAEIEFLTKDMVCTDIIRTSDYYDYEENENVVNQIWYS